MKIIYFLLMLFLFLYPIKTYAISAESYVVMDYDSKRVLLAKASEKEKLIAISFGSILKAIILLIMTINIIDILIILFFLFIMNSPLSILSYYQCIMY